jgi:hypothetical protein
VRHAIAVNRPPNSTCSAAEPQPRRRLRGTPRSATRITPRRRRSVLYFRFAGELKNETAASLTQDAHELLAASVISRVIALEKSEICGKRRTTAANRHSQVRSPGRHVSQRQDLQALRRNGQGSNRTAASLSARSRLSALFAERIQTGMDGTAWRATFRPGTCSETAPPTSRARPFLYPTTACCVAQSAAAARVETPILL